jgi:hypothetical protein
MSRRLHSSFLYKSEKRRDSLLGDLASKRFSSGDGATISEHRKRSRQIALAKHAMQVSRDLLGQKEIPPRITRRDFLFFVGPIDITGWRRR